MNEYINKKALVVGLGRSGVSAANLLANRGAAVTVFDDRGADDLREQIGNLPSGVTLISGGDSIDPTLFDLMVLSPGLPWDSPLPKAARQAGVEVIAELELGARHITAPMIAITGSNGKSTTTALIGEILAHAGKKTFVGGNLGRPLSEAADGDYDWVVVEVSSFQLEGIVSFRPRVALMLNITPDHLDRHLTMEKYTALKMRIFENQTGDDHLIVNGDDPLLQPIKNSSGREPLDFSIDYQGRYGAWIERGIAKGQNGLESARFFDVDQLLIQGAHNIENALAASLGAWIAGIDPLYINEVVVQFTGLRHRMEQISTIDGVTFYNDSKGTNVEATVKSLSGFDKNVALIVGGSDKGADYGPLAETICTHAKGVVLMGETGPAIREALGQFQPKVDAKNMDDAVRIACSWVGEGETVLLSPASASFDMYRNYQERGDAFRSAVESIQKSEGVKSAG